MLDLTTSVMFWLQISKCSQMRILIIYEWNDVGTYLRALLCSYGSDSN